MLRKTITATIRSSPLWLTLIGIGAACDILFRYLSSLSYKFLLDNALLPRDGKALAIVVGALLALGLLNVLAGIAGDYAKAKLGARMLFDYRSKLFRHIQLQTQRFYERFGAGELQARFADDIPAIQYAVIQSLIGGAVSLAGVAVGAAILFTLEWRLTLITLAGSLLLFVPYRLLKARSLALGDAYYEQLDRFNGAIDENIKAHRVIRAFDLRASMRDKVEGNLRSMLAIGVQRSFVSANVTRLPMLAISLLTAVNLSYGSYLTFDGTLSIGDFMAYNSVFFTVGSSLFGVAAAMPHVLSARTSLGRLREVMDWQPDVTERGEQELPALRHSVALRDITFSYKPGTPVLQRFNLDIPASGYTSIVGASGSGKSTVLQLLLRFADPDSGAVTFDDRDIRDVRYDSLLRQVGIVFQDSVLFHATIRENIAIGNPDATDADIVAAATAAGVHETIAGFRDGYGTVVRNQGDNLSGGQRQRIALARALLRKPRLLFLDEATSALDPESERAVNETIASLARDRAIVAVTHRLAYAAISDRIVVLDRGEAAEIGTHEQLMALDGIYRRLWEKQQGFVLSGGRAQVQAERLRRLPFFRGVEPDALEQIARLFVAESFDTGATVVEQGDTGDKFYLIARGKVEVVIASETGERHRVAVLEDGDHFGEIALMQHIPRTASIVTLKPCLLLSLAYDHFHPLLMRFPAMREALEATLQLRLQRSVE